MTYYDKLNYFYAFNSSNHLAPATQLTYLHILHHWNCHRQVNAFYLSDSEIASSTHLGSKAITEAKRVLKNFGLLDFKVIQGRTKFFLPTGNRCANSKADTAESVLQTPPAGSVSVTEPNTKYLEREENAPAQRKNLVGGRRTPIETLRSRFKQPKPEISVETKQLVQDMLARFGTNLKSMPSAD